MVSRTTSRVVLLCLAALMGESGISENVGGKKKKLTTGRLSTHTDVVAVGSHDVHVHRQLLTPEQELQLQLSDKFGREMDKFRQRMIVQAAVRETNMT